MTIRFWRQGQRPGSDGGGGSDPPTVPALVQLPELAREGSSVMREFVDRLQDVVRVADWLTKDQRDNLRAGQIVDVTTAVQAAIDHAMYQGEAAGAGCGAVELPAGRLQLTDTVHVGRGDRFKGAVVFGQGPQYGGESQFGGTSLHPTQTDRPAIAVNGCRQTTIARLTIIGKNQQHIVGLWSSPTNAILDDANWVDPTLHANAASRWAPYAAVAIDPYVGNAPTPAYPNQTYPAFLSGQTQYGRQFSSQVRLRDVEVQGFVVGVLNQVGDADGNGDYTKLERCTFLYNVYPVSICNSQSRVFHLTDSVMVFCHTGIVTTKHGRQNGKPQVNVDNCEIGLCIKWIDAPNTSIGGFKFRDCYGEGVWSIGNAGTNASSSVPCGFDNCHWAFDLGVTGVPTYRFSYQGTAICEFNGCTFDSSCGREHIFADAKKIAWTNNRVFTENAGATQLYQKQALNATGGVTFVGPGGLGITTDLARYSQSVSQHWNLNTGAALGAQQYGERNDGPRSRCLNVYTKHAYAEQEDEGFGVGFNVGIAVSKVGLTIEVSGLDVTITLAGFNAAIYALRGPDVGDICWDEQTGALFYVRSRTGNTLILRAQTGIGLDGELLQAPTASGTLWALNCRRYTPPFVTHGDLTSGNPEIAAVQRPDGDATHLETELPAGDFLYSNRSTDIPFSFGSTPPTISASSNAGKTVTMNLNAARTQARFRLKTFVRPAQPNA